MAYNSLRITRNTDDILNGKLLVEAAKEGDDAQILKLLQAGVSVNAEEYNKSLFYQSENYWTPLQVAVACGHEKATELLIQAQADLHAKDRFDVTAVHLAAEKGHKECLHLLLESGADSNASTKYSKAGCYTATPHPGGTTPLHLAAKANHVECVKELIQNGADYNAVDELGRTSLYIAAAEGLEECILVHLRNAIGRDILSLPVLNTNETPLHCCVRLRMKSCVTALLEHGSDANHRNYSGNTPLHCSIFHSYNKDSESLDIMKELVLKGFNTDVNLVDGSGFSSLHYVSFSEGRYMERRPEAAAFLIAYGANTDITNKRGHTLLQNELQNRLGGDRTILEAIVKVLPVVPNLESLNLTHLLTHWFVNMPAFAPQRASFQMGEA
uniref:Uncharacterized protein n=1 Tax=Strigamia maritima TaxID=126957 RepID=T1IID4_STRMM